MSFWSTHSKPCVARSRRERASGAQHRRVLPPVRRTNQSHPHAPAPRTRASCARDPLSARAGYTGALRLTSVGNRSSELIALALWQATCTAAGTGENNWLSLKNGFFVPVFFDREVKPHVPDAWINTSIRDHKDNEVGKVGDEINFNRYFHQYQPPRTLEQIETEIRTLEKEILTMLRDVAG